MQKKLVLGNLDSRRDWGFAGDYVEAVWRMLQQDKGDDFVVATGKSYSVKDFLSEAFTQLGLEWQDYVEFDAAYTRPAEVDHLEGDFSKARNVLGWTPTLDFKGLAKLMVEEDLKMAEKERVLQTLA